MLGGAALWSAAQGGRGPEGGGGAVQAVCLQRVAETGVAGARLHEQGLGQLALVLLNLLLQVSDCGATCGVGSGKCGERSGAGALPGPTPPSPGDPGGLSQGGCLLQPSSGTA